MSGGRRAAVVALLTAASWTAGVIHHPTAQSTSLTGGVQVARTYDAIMDADFSAVPKLLPDTCPPAPPEVCQLLAVISSLLQLVQSRMMLTPAEPNNDDPNTRIQRQTMLFLPFISILYGSILPAGLFIYWIVATLFSIVQQYLIVGWGAMFPLLGWTPAFARDHTPRFPVAMPPPRDPSTRPTKSVLGGADVSRAAAADKTIRHRERGRQGRRGRRR